MLPAPEVKPTATLTLSDTTLAALMSRPDLKAEFPFLRVTVPKVVGRTCCGSARQAVTQYQNMLDSIKRQLAAMPEDKKKRFKELVRVDQVILFLGGSRYSF